MTRLNQYTQKAQGFIWSYTHADSRTIWDAYKNPSYAKQKAYYQYCLPLMEKMGGFDARITAHGCQTFSFAFRTKDHLVYVTRANDYLIPYKE